MPDAAHLSWQRDEYRISTERARLQPAVIHGYLSGQSYWSKGVPLDVVLRSLDHSLCFGLYRDAAQVGFARVVTDRATFAYLADVFIVPAHRGRGLSKWLMECVMGHPQLQGLRRWMLATRDAHSLYARYGFTALRKPEILMERHDPDVYQRSVGRPETEL